MADHLTAERRSWNMSRIRGKDTSIEKKVRSYLFAQGLRFRKNVSKLPGKPDIVLPKYHTVIFVHGCFWHRHQGCKYATSPSTNVEYWERKFEKNVENDGNHIAELKSHGWKVLVVWECDVKHRFKDVMEDLVRKIKSESKL